MSTPLLNKLQINGYQVLSVNHGPWKVCTAGDRLATFGTREEAMAFAALPVRRASPATPHR